MAKKTGKNDKAAQVTTMITGLKKRFPNGSQTVTFGGGTFTVDQVGTKLQSFVDNRNAVEAAQANTKAKVAAEEAQRPALLVFIAAFVTFIRLTFDDAPDVLADFDIPPPKARTPMTAEEKAVAAAKARATRQARGTTSAKAKKKVKGNVTAALVVSPAASSTPAAPAAAPVAPTGTGTGSSPGGAAPTAHS